MGAFGQGAYDKDHVRRVALALPPLSGPECSTEFYMLEVGDKETKAPMRVFKSKAFVKFARGERIGDSKLCAVVKDAGNEIINADYGGGVIKQRIARSNEANPADTE